MVKIVVDGITIETERHNITIKDDDPIDIDNRVIAEIKRQAKDYVLKKYDKVMESLANK